MIYIKTNGAGHARRNLNSTKVKGQKFMPSSNPSRQCEPAPNKIRLERILCLNLNHYHQIGLLRTFIHSRVHTHLGILMPDSTNQTQAIVKVLNHLIRCWSLPLKFKLSKKYEIFGAWNFTQIRAGPTKRLVLFRTCD